MDEEPLEEMEPVEVPIDGTLDLHNFQPREVVDLVPDYLEACREKGILQVRIVHETSTVCRRWESCTNESARAVDLGEYLCRVFF